MKSRYLSNLSSAASRGNLGVKPVLLQSNIQEHMPGRLNGCRRVPRSQIIFFNGMKDSHGVFQPSLGLTDCKPKSNKYPKQGWEFTAPVVTAALSLISNRCGSDCIQPEKVLPWKKGSPSFVRYSFITWTKLLRLCSSGWGGVCGGGSHSFWSAGNGAEIKNNLDSASKWPGCRLSDRK